METVFYKHETEAKCGMLPYLTSACIRDAWGHTQTNTSKHKQTWKTPTSLGTRSQDREGNGMWMGNRAINQSGLTQWK